MGLSISKYASNDYELAIRTSKELEYILEKEFGGSGRGLHEKISSIGNQLPSKLVSQMRYLATIRNKLIHERGFNKIPDRNKFIQQFEEAEAELKEIIEKRNGTSCIIM